MSAPQIKFHMGPAVSELEVKAWSAAVAQSRADAALWKSIATEWAKRALRAEVSLARYEGALGDDRG